MWYTYVQAGKILIKKFKCLKMIEISYIKLSYVGDYVQFEFGFKSCNRESLTHQFYKGSMMRTKC